MPPTFFHLTSGYRLSAIGYYPVLLSVCQDAWQQGNFYRYNGHMHIQIDPQIDEHTAAAIMAAIEVVLASEDRRAPEDETSRSVWSTAGILGNQGLPGARSSIAWSTADRAGRAARWSSGVLASFHEW